MSAAAPTGVVLAELLYKRETFIMNLCIFTGFVLWDCAVCVPDEVRYIFYPEVKALCKGKRKRVALPTLLLLLARLLVLPMVALQLTVAHGQPSNCYAVYKTMLTIYGIIVANGTAVFVVRTLAIRGSKWPLQVFLWTVWVGHSFFWFFSGHYEDSVTQLPKEPYTATCVTHSLVSWTWLLYLANALFDVLILLLTLQTQFASWNDVMHPRSVWKRTRSDLSQLFYRDAMMYFFISVAVSLAIVIWIVQNVEEHFFTVLIAPIHIALHLTISPRVIRTLKLHNAKANLSSLGHSIETSRGQSSTNRTLEAGNNHGGVHFETSKTSKVSEVDDYESKGSSPRDDRYASLHPAPVAELHRLDSVVVPFSSE